MKSLATLLVILLFLAACHNNSKSQPIHNDSTSSITASDEADARLEKMRGLAPLPAEKIKAMFPEELDSLKLSDYSPVNNEGYETGEGVYKSDSGKEIYVTILDCVGEAGVGKYNLMYLAYLNADSKNDDSYQKTISFNGDKAIESYEKDDDRYSLLLTSGKRLLVKVEGKKTTLDEVKQAARELRLATN